MKQHGTYDEKQLYHFITRAISDLKQNSTCGTKIPKRLWPKEYQVTNLWKYDLPNAWRLPYTIESDGIVFVSIILEWFSHKEYERRFKY
ncbi:MAG: hypothetical protein V1725_01650 [archaeon]